MIELKTDRKHKHIRAFTLEKGDSSSSSFSKADFIVDLKKASRRISLPAKGQSKT